MIDLILFMVLHFMAMIILCSIEPFGEGNEWKSLGAVFCILGGWIILVS